MNSTTSSISNVIWKQLRALPNNSQVILLAIGGQMFVEKRKTHSFLTKNENTVIAKNSSSLNGLLQKGQGDRLCR